jgi:hypothetical protein
MPSLFDSTPDRQSNPHDVAPSPLDILLRAMQSTPTDTATQTTPHHITPDQLNLILQRFQQQQATIDHLLQREQQHNSNKAKIPDYYNIAKYEDIICKGLKPLYDGSSKNLIPFLNRLNIRRQDESWYPSTIINVGSTSFDLTREFAKIQEADIIRTAESRWKSLTISEDKLKLDHLAYNARVLGRLLMASITDEFSLTIVNRIPQDLRNDGPLILWTICNHIHRNNIAFIGTIKTKIRDATLSHFGDDINKYIIFIKDNLRLISAAMADSAEHNDLITYLFAQLTKSNINMF